MKMQEITYQAGTRKLIYRRIERIIVSLTWILPRYVL